MSEESSAQNPQNARNPAEHLKGHRWKKGQSGNPGGRPKGKSVTAALAKIAKTSHNGRPISVLLAERLMKEALGGKYQFAREVVERLEGLVPRPGEARQQEQAQKPHRFINVILCPGGCRLNPDGTPNDDGDCDCVGECRRRRGTPPPRPPDGRENVRVLPP